MTRHIYPATSQTITQHSQYYQLGVPIFISQSDKLRKPSSAVGFPNSACSVFVYFVFSDAFNHIENLTFKAPYNWTIIVQNI